MNLQILGGMAVLSNTDAAVSRCAGVPPAISSKISLFTGGTPGYQKNLRLGRPVLKTLRMFARNHDHPTDIEFIGDHAVAGRPECLA